MIVDISNNRISMVGYVQGTDANMFSKVLKTEKKKSKISWISWIAGIKEAMNDREPQEVN